MQTNKDAEVPVEEMLTEILDTGKENRCSTHCNKFKEFLLNNVLPVTLIVAIVFGILVPWPGDYINHKAVSFSCIVWIFIYNGLYMRTSDIKNALQAYKALIWGFLSIIFITSAIGGHLTSLLVFDPSLSTQTGQTMNQTTKLITQQANASFLRTSKPQLNVSQNSFTSGNATQNYGGDNSTHSTDSLYIGPNEFLIGMQVYFIMPCTVTSGVIMVSQLGGDVVLTLLLVVVTNIVSVFTIPLMLKWVLSNSQLSISLDMGKLLLRLSLLLLLPLIVGKLLRYIKRLKEIAIRKQVKLTLKLSNVFALGLIVLLKVSAASMSGQLLQVSVLGLVVIASWSIAIHLLFVLLNVAAGYALRLKLEHKKCVVVLASQKTMAVGVTVVTLLPPVLGNTGLMTISMVIAHLSILLLDSFLIALYMRYEKSHEKKPIDNQNNLENQAEEVLPLTNGDLDVKTDNTASEIM